jgi:hypothetical protein
MKIPEGICCADTDQLVTCVSMPVLGDWTAPNTATDKKRTFTQLVIINLGATLFWIITQRVAIISYQCFGTAYQSHPQGSRIQKKAFSPNMEFT